MGGKKRKNPLKIKESLRKKVLSLVLCVAVMLSVMVLGAGAAFSDQDQIENTEAVDTCVALNIIGGYEDGSFHPERNIKRSEITKMICVALNGGVEPNLSVPATPTFSDVRDTADGWAEKYIESCVAQGIVSGVGGGRFSPAGNVTGSQLAKMLLVCLGYDSDIEKFTGNSWDTNVNVIATQKGLYEGLETMDVSAAVTRDQAAQMVWNALQANMVKYEYTLVSENGQLVSKPVVKDDTDRGTLLKDKYKVKMTYGQLTDVDGKSITIVPDYNYSEKVTGTIDSDTTFTQVAEDYSSLLGQTVKVIYKSSSQVIGVAPMSDNVVYETVASAVEVDGAKVKFDDTSYSLSEDDKDQAAITTTADQITVLTVNVDGNVTSTAARTSAYFNAPVSYFGVKFIDNDNDGKLEYAVLTEMVPGEVTYASDTEVIVGGTSYKTADHQVAEGIAKDDYVVVTGDAYNSNKVIKKVEPITGKVEGYKTANGGSDHMYMVGGTWYIADTKQTADAGDDMELIAVNGVIFYSDKVSGSSNLDGVVLVADVDDNSTNVVINAAIVKADGTKATVKVDTVSTGYVIPSEGGLYTYTETDNGYKFKAVTADIGDYEYTGSGLSLKDVAGTTDASKKIGSIKDGSNDVGIADDAVIFLYDTTNNTGKTITGKQLKNLNYADTYSADAMFVGESNGLDRVVMAVVSASSMPTVGDVAENYGLIVSNAYKMDSDYITYQVWNGSEVVIVKEKDTTVLASRTQMTVIAYSAIDADGVIKDVATGVATDAYVHGLSSDGKTVWLNGQSDSTDKYEINADTVIMYYDSTTDKAEEIGKAGGELKLADKIGGTYIDNVKYVDADGDKKLDFVLVEVKNNIGTTYTLPSPTGSTLFDLAAVTTGTQKGGNTITYLLKAESVNNAATQVRVTLTDASSGTQVVYVTVPAGTATTEGSVEVSFRQPADSSSTVTAADVVTVPALTCTNTDSNTDGTWDADVNGLNGVASIIRIGTGDVYEGDTVRYAITLAGTLTSTNATVTFTSAATVDEVPTGAGRTDSTKYTLTAGTFANGVLYADVTAGTAGSFVVETV